MAPEMTTAARRKAGFVLLAIAAVAGGLAVLVYELDAEERDRHAVQAILSDVERKLRAHDGSAWLLSEGALPPGQAHPGDEPAHEGIRADLDRLAHLDRLQILPGDVDIHADTATVGYGILGTSRLGDPPAPRGGQFEFRRGGEGWYLAANRFLDEPPQAGGSRGPVHRHSHAGLWARLGGIAVLALLGRAFLLIQPVVARALRTRRVRPRRS